MDTLRKIIISLSVLGIVSLLSSCRKMPQDGDLDGQWKIKSIEYLDDNHVEYPDGLYYCLFRSVVNLTGKEYPVSVERSGNLVCRDNKLTLSMPYATAGELIQWGIAGTEVTFDIKRLSGDKMTLQSDYSIIEFRKF